MNKDEFSAMRKAKNHTQKSLAEALHKSIRHISRIETSDSDVSVVMELALKAVKARRK